MRNIETHIDEIVSKVLAEAISFKADNILNKAKNGITESLHGGQKKIDVAEPKGKITAADFEKLRSKKQKSKTQAGFEHGEIVSGDVDENWDDKSDGQGWSEANKLSKNEPLYRGTKFVKEDINEYSFGDTETDDDLSYNDMLPSSEDEKQIKTPHKVKNVGDKYERKVSKEFSEGEVDENMFKKMFGKKEDPEVAREKDRKENPYLGNLGYDYDDIRGWHYVGPGQGRFDKDSEDGEIEEGMYGSFDDEHGWYDKDDRQHTGDFDFDFDEEEFSDFDSLMNKHGKNQRWFGKDGKMYFDKYQEKFGGKPFRVRTRKNEMGEGNAFSGALANAKKDGKNSFEVDGKTYQVKESKRTNSVKEKVIFTESELINFIERLVEAEKVVDKGFKTAMNSTKKENTDAIKQVAAKMKDYMKNMGTEYEENPQSFPKGNKIMSREDFGKEVSDDKKNAYDASDAVDEYIDAFAYPGQTNLVFDEIKPDDTKIEKYLKGHSTTGNAQVDEDGNALGNVVPSEVGEKFYKNYKENLYGAEQMNASYKRQPAPVDIAGSEKSNGNLKSLKASQQIFNKLEESVENKKVISEMEKMKNLIGYNRKTQ